MIYVSNKSDDTYVAPAKLAPESPEIRPMSPEQTLFQGKGNEGTEHEDPLKNRNGKNGQI